jgi:RHS repeat-associated protein
VRLVLDSSGNIQGELRYNEWGVPEAAVSPLSAPAAGLSGHSYTGGLGVRNDGASLGLYYARQRFFDPTLARWLTPDPIGFSGGLNLYMAMENSPIGTVDPEGLQGEEIIECGGKTWVITRSIGYSGRAAAPVMTAAATAPEVMVPLSIVGFLGYAMSQGLNSPGARSFGRAVSRFPSSPLTIPRGRHTCPPLNRIQQRQLEELKQGRDVFVRNINTARALIENSGLEPYTEQRHGARPAPRGTFRGDLINTSNPTADYVHAPGTAKATHANNPHYNLYFWNGQKGTIIILP